MIFKEPAMLLLLAGLPILGKLFTRARRLQNEAATTLRGERTIPTQLNRKNWFILSSLGSLILALSQPAWNPHPGPLSARGRDLVIALDISRSMLANDVFPSRLEATKIALFESLEMMPGQRIGLITFAGAASVRVPLTLDHNFVRYMLERAAPYDADVGSTSLQAAIEKATDIALSESKKGMQDIILFTDGEDHISNIEKTTEELRECGARVLIIGLGDPLAGAKVPEVGSTNSWMQYKGEDVITKLDEQKLMQLSAQSPNVTYYAARTRPFDLIALYQQMIKDTAGLPGDETHMVYTEGFPLFIALALILWLLPLNRRLFPALALLLLAGCAPQRPGIDEEMAQGRAKWTEAQKTIEADPGTALSILFEARKEFLQAAMIQPGNVEIARQIAGVTRQIRAAEKAVEEQAQAEQDLQQQLQEAVEKLRLLVPRETTLSETSRRLLRTHPPVSAENKAAAVQPALDEQNDIHTLTAEVFDTVSSVQKVVRKMLEKVYGDTDAPPPTEFDDAAQELDAAQQSQLNAVSNLKPESVSWTLANSSFHSATRHMQEALNMLDQNTSQNSQDGEEGSEEEGDDWEFEEDMEWSESDMAGDMSMPMESGEFKSDLSNQALPTPNYTSDDILMEEAANMESRAQQKSKSSGAKVEKNW